jgi:hypothetical protein
VSLQKISTPFYALAHRIVTPPTEDQDAFGLSGPEATTALRKLLEAKDCAVRAELERQREQAASDVGT